MIFSARAVQMQLQLLLVEQMNINVPSVCVTVARDQSPVLFPSQTRCASCLSDTFLQFRG